MSYSQQLNHPLDLDVFNKSTISLSFNSPSLVSLYTLVIYFDYILLIFIFHILP